MMPGKGIAHGIKRTGADIAENHADRADRHLQDTALMMAMAFIDQWICLPLSDLGENLRAVFDRFAHACALSP